jgi:hypothetical protein
VAPHLIDGYSETLAALTNHVSDASDHVFTDVDYFHIPEFAIAFVAVQNYRAYRGGRMSLEDALANFGERSVLATIASGLGWAATAASHSTGVGIPVAIVARLFGGQLMHNRDRRKALDELVCNVQASRERLEHQLPRGVEKVALPS